MAAAFPLKVHPQLASWDAAGSPSQVRLTGFLDSFERVYRSIPLPRGPLAFRLNIAHPAGSSLLTDHDLDNYLTPVCTRLRGQPFASVWATKLHGDVSTIQLEEATPSPEEQGWKFAHARPAGSASSASWKQDLRDQVARQASLVPDGAIALQISFLVGPSRQWQNLWKQSIDALGSIVGCEDGSRPFDVRDGRIVTLGLHRTVAPDMGHDVELGIWWRPVEGLADDEVRRRHRVAAAIRTNLAQPMSRTRRPEPVPGLAEPGSAGRQDVVEFRHDDAGYIRWTATNPLGYVVNTTPSYSSSYLMLHRATCRTVTEFQGGCSRWTTGDYIKVCSLDRESLVRWARETAGGALRAGCHCLP